MPLQRVNMNTLNVREMLLREMKMAALRETNNSYERKWGMTFDEFARQSRDGTLKEDAYSWNVEQDFWGWEQAVTLLNHYGSLAV
jgi:hypothetical protein